MRFVPPLLFSLITLAAWAALSQPLLPPCGPGLDGQVSQSGCSCRYRPAAQLSAEPAGWRWSCDLLRGSTAAPAPADLPGSGAPPLNLMPSMVIEPRSAPGQHGY